MPIATWIIVMPKDMPEVLSEDVDEVVPLWLTILSAFCTPASKLDWDAIPEGTWTNIAGSIADTAMPLKTLE